MDITVGVNVGIRPCGLDEYVVMYLHHGMDPRDSLLVLAHSTGCGWTSWTATSSQNPACGALWPCGCVSYGISLSLSLRQDAQARATSATGHC